MDNLLIAVSVVIGLVLAFRNQAELKDEIRRGEWRTGR
jgi:hypothetical protein